MIKLQALARRFISNKSTEAEQIDTPSGDLFQCDGFIRLKTWRPPLPEAWKSTENNPADGVEERWATAWRSPQRRQTRDHAIRSGATVYAGAGWCKSLGHASIHWSWVVDRVQSAVGNSLIRRLLQGSVGLRKVSVLSEGRPVSGCCGLRFHFCSPFWLLLVVAQQDQCNK